MSEIIEDQDKELLKRVNTLEANIGNTPLMLLPSYSTDKIKIYAKLEWFQLGGSVKSRPAFNMIKHAILDGKLNRSKTILDATSGNTGISIAAIGAALGLNVKLILPLNANNKRKEIIKSFGAQTKYSNPVEGTDGSQVLAQEILDGEPDKYVYLNQYANKHNWLSHYHGTALEIINQSNGDITHFIAGLGTTGTFTGTAKRLKESDQNIVAVALQPSNPLHGLEGWKHLETVKIPEIYDSSLPDEIKSVDSIAAIRLAKEVALKEGLLLSTSSAANLLGAINLSKTISKGNIVTIFPDTIDRYDHIFKP